MFGVGGTEAGDEDIGVEGASAGGGSSGQEISSFVGDIVAPVVDRRGLFDFQDLSLGVG